MKKSLSVLLLLMLLLAMLSGCESEINSWEDSFHLKTFGDVFDALGKPDLAWEDSPRGMDEYHDVTLGGVEGVYMIGGGALRSGADSDYISSRMFFCTTAYENVKFQDTLAEMKDATAKMLAHLTKTYGQPTTEVDRDAVTYTWHCTLEDDATMEVVFSVPSTFEIFAYSDDPNVLTSDYLSDPAFVADGKLLFVGVEYKVTHK